MRAGLLGVLGLVSKKPETMKECGCSPCSTRRWMPQRGLSEGKRLRDAASAASSWPLIGPSPAPTLSRKHTSHGVG
jgi:hypothetical protein